MIERKIIIMKRCGILFKNIIKINNENKRKMSKSRCVYKCRRKLQRNFPRDKNFIFTIISFSLSSSISFPRSHNLSLHLITFQVKYSTISSSFPHCLSPFLYPHVPYLIRISFHLTQPTASYTLNTPFPSHPSFSSFFPISSS